MQRSIRYGDARIAFAIHFVPKPRRRITIHVLPEGSIRVDAPEDATPEAVIGAVRRRARWLWNELEARRERCLHVLPREYVSGESHFYLGRRHMLKVELAEGEKTSVKLLRGKLLVTVPRRDSSLVRSSLEDWCRQRAREVFARRLAELAPRLAWLSAVPSFRLLNMRTQWGSCSPSGELVLNPQLAKAPRICIDYVIYHELCHLREHNHSPEYYRLLESVMPDWASHKEMLDSLAEVLLNR
jgi:predicted metal-dependent hydrolase